nr:putative late blight resistance protein homolog R1B-14 [Ipomoea batatas]
MAPVVEEDIVVGFDDEVKILKDRLFRESMNLTVISIVGMIGVGKTTFANMVFNDMELKYEFFTQIWVYVSQACDRRQIFLDILKEFTETSNDFQEMSDENLAERIKEYLEGGKYLIVLDDMWTEKDWEQLEIAFPNNLKGSRILVTTRYQNVASQIDSTGIPHELKYLSEDECWELLEKKIFGGERCLDTSLEAVGRSIAKKCNGVPLVVGKISDLLSENKTVAEWRRIESNPFASIEYEDDELFLGDLKLMYLWVAEGFVSGDDLEYTAEKYLNDFVERNLLKVVTRRADEGIKRVLNIRGFKFPSKQLPKELHLLQNLTYLGITIIHLNLLPKEFETLTKLQTLALHTATQNTSTTCSVKIEADIWSCMPNLRHLLTNTRARLQLPLPTPIIRRSRLSGRKNGSSRSRLLSAAKTSKIITLSTISPTSCTPQILDNTPQIQKLGIRGNLAELMDVNQGGVSLFDNLHKLDSLENLKLTNDALQSNTLLNFPREKFPRRIRKMTLSNTAFEWKDLSALGSLDKLEVLKLEDNAFRGESCDVRSVVFKRLQYFRIGRTDLVSWTASKESFPVLKCLSLRKCTELDAVPVEFGEIESLKLLELYYTSKRAVNSAQEIQKLKGGFQLSVNPPEHSSEAFEFELKSSSWNVSKLDDINMIFSVDNFPAACEAGLEEFLMKLHNYEDLKVRGYL